jgi:membrane protease YdiL (CAAX protease family)
VNSEALRSGAALLLAVATAWGFDHIMARRGMRPPGFAVAWRRAAALAMLAAFLWFGALQPLLQYGQPQVPFDPKNIWLPALFSVHAVLAAVVVSWWLLGYSGVRAAGDSASFRRQFGLTAVAVRRELGLGILVGLSTWSLVVILLLVFVGGLVLLGGEDVVPSQPPPMIPFLVGLPIWFRATVALSAGVFEELFFRGFLQPRVGVLASTALFALAHLGYGQPLMLVGITLLSLLYAVLVRWRQSIWAAIAAHAVFDAVQMLLVIPAALDLLGGDTPIAPLPLLGAWIG